MINEVKQEAEKGMKRSLDALGVAFSKIRTGRANIGLLDHVMVDYYGQQTPLNQVASITASDARTLTVSPWEKNLVPAIEKAILIADLGLNPVSAGQTIRVPMPALSEDRRKELIRLVKAETEQARVAVRNARRDGNQALKDLLKSKAITEDDERRTSEWMQKLTDDYIAKIDGLLAHKEKDLMEI